MHGITVEELTTGTRPIVAVATSVIGLVATATAAAGAPTNALNAAFPVGQAVLVSSVRAAIDQAGTGGTLKSALSAIADQASTVVVVVRITAGVDAAATDAAVEAGLQQLLTAESQLGVRPRILGAPGLDSAAVAAELAIVAQRLRAMAYISCAAADTLAEAATYSGTFAARELMPIYPDFTGGFAGDAVARALGLRSRIDQEIGWHKSLSNVAINGVSGGLTQGISFDLLGDDHDAALLNAANITTMVRQNGWRFWGNRTCSADPRFAFETAVRTNQVLQDEIAAGIAWAVDMPITTTLVKDIIETGNARFRTLKAQGRIIGATMRYDPDQNSQVDLAAGKLVIDYDFTPCAPAEHLLLRPLISDRYYASFADALAN